MCLGGRKLLVITLQSYINLILILVGSRNNNVNVPNFTRIIPCSEKRLNYQNLQWMYTAIGVNQLFWVSVIANILLCFCFWYTIVFLMLVHLLSLYIHHYYGVTFLVLIFDWLPVPTCRLSLKGELRVFFLL